MEDFKSLHSVRVIWRGNNYVVEMDPDASLKSLGDELQKLTNIKQDTLRLIVPLVSGKGSKLLSPYSKEHSNLSLREASVVEGKSIRMMGASEDEVEKVQQAAKDHLRIAGFDEEERRMRLRMTPRSSSWVKLPQGPYTFGGFRALQLPGIELNPPAIEALKMMHKLAADPGIVAIMNKHRWSVGIMTEMAPVGYVGVSPKCVLGFNKNCGEEISLRLRTDDLKGFRKYESIKRTLLHELAHMVYLEHDENFFALDKQLNQEAASLDWTKSRGHTLGAVRNLDYDEEDYDASDTNYVSQKLGGSSSDQLGSARETSVAAAYRRFTDVYEFNSGVHGEPDPDDSRSTLETRLDDMDPLNNLIHLSKTVDEPYPDDLESKQIKSTDKNIHLLDHNNFLVSESMGDGISDVNKEQNPEESETKRVVKAEPDPDDVMATLEISGMKIDESIALDEPDPDDSHANRAARNESVPEPENYQVGSQVTASVTIDEPDPDDEELKRIQDPVSFICNRLKKAVEMLRTEANPAEASTALQTLFKIIRNVIEHPNETKFKRLRKANPLIQKNVAKYKVAMEILEMIGFVEEAVLEGTGTRETYIVLKRNDPGLLWLAKSCLEGSVAC